MNVGVMLDAVNADVRGRWHLERRLAGCWKEGAYLLSRSDGSRAVLKWRASDPEQLLGAYERVDGSPAHGWPAPAWLAAGPTPTGKAWIVQEFIDGRPPQQLTDRVAEQMLEILACRHRCFLALWAVGIGRGLRGLGRSV